MAQQQSMLEGLKARIEQANQGTTNGNTNLNNNPAPNPGGFLVSNGMIQAPGMAPKTLSGSYMSV